MADPAPAALAPRGYGFALTPLVDLGNLSAGTALGEMLRTTRLNPLDALDRALYGKSPGLFFRYVGVRQVLVMTRIPW